jgi:hypothetical protein
MNRSFLSDFAAISEALQYTTNFSYFQEFSKIFFISLSLLSAPDIYPTAFSEACQYTTNFSYFQKFSKIFFYFAVFVVCTGLASAAISEACQYTTKFRLFQARTKKLIFRSLPLTFKAPPVAAFLCRAEQYTSVFTLSARLPRKTSWFAAQAHQAVVSCRVMTGERLHDNGPCP